MELWLCVPFQDPWHVRKATVRSTRHGKPTPTQRIMAPLILGLIVLGLWALVTSGGTIEEWRLPSPGATIDRGILLLSEPRTWARIGVTVSEAALGCLLGAAVAIPLSIGIHSSRLMAAAIEPFLGASQALPAIAIAPLLVLWLGYGLFPIAALCALMVFFPILIASVVGLSTIDPEIIQAAALDGAGRWTMLRRISIPLAAPSILSGVRNGFTLSFTGAIVGELVMGGEGLGQSLTQARQSLDTAAMFVVIIILCVLSSSIYFLLRSIEARIIAERFES